MRPHALANFDASSCLGLNFTSRNFHILRKTGFRLSLLFIILWKIIRSIKWIWGLSNICNQTSEEGVHHFLEPTLEHVGSLSLIRRYVDPAELVLSRSWRAVASL